MKLRSCPKPTWWRKLERTDSHFTWQPSAPRRYNGCAPETMRFSASLLGDGASSTVTEWDSSIVWSFELVEIAQKLYQWNNYFKYKNAYTFHVYLGRVEKADAYLKAVLIFSPHYVRRNKLTSQNIKLFLLHSHIAPFNDKILYCVTAYTTSVSHCLRIFVSCAVKSPLCRPVVNVVLKPVVLSLMFSFL